MVIQHRPSRAYPGEELVIRYDVYDSDGNLTDPLAITFQYRQGKFGTKTSVTPVQQSTGIYHATFSTDENNSAPAVHYEWKTTTPNSREEGHVSLKPSRFSSIASGDYG